MLQRFFKNFDYKDSTLRKKFAELWSHLYDIYEDFNHRMRQQGLAYEGMLYRDALTHDMDFPSDHYLFVGFNMLHKVEQKLFQRLKQQGKARFYWDFDKYYVGAKGSYGMTDHEAGVYIKQYLTLFPNELQIENDAVYDNFSNDKNITYVSALTEDIQARYISDWIKQNGRMEAGNHTAIVMCNENLLHTVLHCIPPEVQGLNVTTGYPLQLSPIASLVTQLVTLRWNGYSQKRQAFRLRYVNNILRHPYASLIYKDSAQLVKALNANKQFYVTTTMIPDDDYLRMLFSPVESSDNANADLLSWLLRIVKTIAVNGSEQSDPFFQESLFRMYTLLNRLYELVNNGKLEISKTTMQRFITQSIAATTIPFHGEPAVGVQLMGVLETRNLDFDHLLILSCNEGNMPKGVNDASFIPYAVRKAYGLTTVDHKVAIYSYYFHRLLQRCNDITITYNKSTEGTSTGEMSQFMLQLLVELGKPVRRLSLSAGQTPYNSQVAPVRKDDKVMARLERYTTQDSSSAALSPTAVNTYLRCPLRFYYKYVAMIYEPDNQDEDIIERIRQSFLKREDFPGFCSCVNVDVILYFSLLNDFSYI